MMLMDHVNTFSKRVLNVYKSDGAKGVLIRIEDRFRWIKERVRSKVSYYHALVMCSSISEPSTMVTEKDPLVVRARERARTVPQQP